jgi:tRNA/tmRNA/rRNA uracil-C5-methylase (TrmA/RlmC/RlmD family)
MDPLLTDEGLEGAVLELEVGAIAHGGHCVARCGDGRVVFVRHALPGELVRAVVTEERRGYLRADAVEVLSASRDRVTPPCPWAGPDRCGGCDFQHVSPSAQLALKAAVVREQLERLGGLPAAELDALDISVRSVGEPLGWRTRIRYTVDGTGRAGLLKHRSHEVVPIDWCRIAHPGVRDAPVLGAEWPDLDSVEVAASATGEVSVTGSRGRASVLISGPSRVHERAGGREWSVPAASFWQVHPAAADTLASVVVELLEPRRSERAWDLYGGVGLFAAALAPALDSTGRVTVVEADPSAAAAARRNLRDLTTVTVLRSDVDRALANPRWRSVDLVVLDPPRSGAGADVVRAIADRRPRAVAYVACDPAALARDVRTFAELGYRLAALRAYDLFPMSHHVECVALMAPGSR